MESLVNNTDGIVFTIEDFISESNTKSAFDVSTMKFQWSSSDAIGIFPGEGWQTEFKMTIGAGCNTAVFDGGHWGLKTDGTYYAYYPFSKENFESEDSCEKVRYSYEGQEACFADGNGIVNLDRYDFMASGAGTVNNDKVNFDFKHLGALCKVNFTVPVTATYTHILIDVGKAIIPVTGYFDATDRDGDGIVALVSDSAKSSQLKVLLPSGHNKLTASEQVELYFLMPPVDLSNQILDFQLIDSFSNAYNAVIESKNIKAGFSYAWKAELDYYQAPSGTEPANCYIVTHSGTYTFPTVRGNSSSLVGEVASAEVLWESFGTDITPNIGDLVSEVSYSDGCISYKASDLKGNAVIAAKDASGAILWSWHIWLTDKPEDQVYNNNAGTMMDRNLGATSATPGDVSALGLLYQWGRKDPFLGSSSISSSTKAKSTITWPSAVSSDASVGTINYTLGHPTTFINGNSRNFDWLYPTSTSIDNTRWQSSKTIYDPCPAGYQVPGNFIWSKAFGDAYDPEFDSTNRGYDFCWKDELTIYLTQESCWYPAAGYLYCSSGSLNYVGSSGRYWSCSPYSYSAYYLFFHYDGDVDPSYYDSRASGQSVRCLRE